jgi:hypothetical protein
MDKSHHAMKTIISRSLLLFATVFTLGYARAAEPLRTHVDAKRSALERSLDRALNKNLVFPLLDSREMTGVVNVSFVVDKEGRIQVLECSSANPSLKAYVLRKLARIDIGENPEGSWKTSHIRFNFHKEEV